MKQMPEDRPLVSVVVLTYRKFDKLKTNLESIAKQDYPNIEVIIQDDASPNFNADGLEDLCKATLGGLNWSVRHNEKNVGTVKNFNAAVFAAGGELVLPLSQDDRFFTEDAVTKIAAFFAEHPECMSCTAKRMGETSGKVFPNKEDAALLASWDTAALWCRMVYENFISGSVLYYRTGFLKRRDGFDTDFLLVEDYPFAASMILENQRIGFLDEITIVYGEAGVSNSTDQSPKLLADRVVFYEKYIVPNQNLVGDPRLKQYLAYLYGDIRCRQDLPRRVLHHLRHWNVVARLLYGKYVKGQNVEERYHLWKR